MEVSLTKHFRTYFTPVLANTTELLAEVYRIRYQVYCEELQYEPAEKFPDGMEQDIYDRRSLHYLLKHNPSGRYVGCVRVILPAWQQPEASFPLEKVCYPQIDLTKVSRKHFCEVSRLAVLSEFRRCHGEGQIPEGLLFPATEETSFADKKRRLPLISIALQAIHISIAAQLGLDILCIMEPRLSRHLRLQGIINHQIGPVVDYHGKRAPFLLQPQEILDNLNNPDIRNLFDTIGSEVRKALQAYTYENTEVLAA